MNKWALNLSQEQYEQLTRKKGFVNEHMIYSIDTVKLPNNRVMVKLSMDVFGAVPTKTALKKYLDWDVGVIPQDTPQIGMQLSSMIGEQFIVSYLWQPNVADYCLADLYDREAWQDYMFHIFTAIPRKDWKFIIHKYRPKPNDYQMDYDASKHEFDLITLGLFDILASINTVYRNKHINNVVNVLENHLKLIHCEG